MHILLYYIIKTDIEYISSCLIAILAMESPVCGPVLPPNQTIDKDKVIVNVLKYKGTASEQLPGTLPMSSRLKIITVDSMSFLTLRAIDKTFMVTYGKETTDLDVLVYSSKGNPIPTGTVLLKLGLSTNPKRKYNLLYEFDDIDRAITPEEDHKISQKSHERYKKQDRAERSRDRDEYSRRKDRDRDDSPRRRKDDSDDVFRDKVRTKINKLKTQIVALESLLDLD